tara:strand:- start:1109 stop:1567 length:459 start_codon:yes stop_codon:yes gene_type:complete
MKKAILLMLLCLGISCSGTHQANPNTTLTSDYYGIRESTSGGGYDNPREAERLLLGGSRPLTLIFSAPWCKPCKVLSEEITKMGIHDKVWILDVASSTTQMLAVFTDEGQDSIPTMVHLNKRYGKIIKKDLISIIEFLQKEYNPNRTEKIYD